MYDQLPFLGNVMADHKLQAINRPLIFIAHSLGGIVVKKVCSALGHSTRNLAYSERP